MDKIISGKSSFLEVLSLEIHEAGPPQVDLYWLVCTEVAITFLFEKLFYLRVSIPLKSKQTYRINNGENNIDNQEQEFRINDQLVLETLLLMIRGSTINSQRKKQRQEEETKLEQDIKWIEEEVNANFLNLSEDVLNELENKKSLLNEIQKGKIEGVLLRSRSRYEDLGEKPSHYFFNLEKRNLTSKVIHKLVNEEGKEVTETSDVLKYQTNFL